MKAPEDPDQGGSEMNALQEKQDNVVAEWAPSLEIQLKTEPGRGVVKEARHG